LQIVTVQDTVPPTLDVALDPATLWPPDHELVGVGAELTAVDLCDPAPALELVSIASDEPDDGPGDGHTVGDIQGADLGSADGEFLLRAERQGGGDGRVYTVVYSAADASGNAVETTAEVVVPKSRER
jgi:hypothetical protein